MNEKNDFETSKTSTRKMAFYASARLGSSMVLGIEGFALSAFYYVGLGVPFLLIGIAQAIGFIIIGFGQFFFGWISDAKYTKWGRRKPYILLLTPLLAISFIMLLFPTLILPDLNDKIALFLWFLLWDALFKIGYSMTTVYQAWVPEQFITEKRPKVSQFQNYFNYIGNAIMFLMTMLVLSSFADQLEVNINSPMPSDFLILTILFGIILIALFYIVAILMPTEPYSEIDTDLIGSLKLILKNKNYLRIILMIGISSLGWSIITDVMLTYSLVVLNIGGDANLIISIILIVGILIFVLMWRKLVEKKGKKTTLLMIFLFAVITLPLSLVGLLEFATNIVFALIMVTCIAAMLGGWGLFPYIIYADVAEDDEKNTGCLKAGIYTGFNSIILNAFQAFGVLVLGVVIDSLPEITVGSLTYSLGLVLWGPICSGILLCSFLYTRKYVRLDFDWEKAK